MKYQVKIYKQDNMQSGSHSVQTDQEFCIQRLAALGFTDGVLVEYIRHLPGAHIFRQGQAMIALSDYEYSILELSEIK